MGGDGDHERSLVAWANTFAEAGAPTASLADFASGDALLPIARTITRRDSNDQDDKDSAANATGWAGVFWHMQSAGLIEEGDQVPGDDDEEQKLATAVTCLEDLLRHTVGEHCLGRETFIRQIMSLDANVQTTLRQIIVGEQPQQQQSDTGSSSSEAGSPSRDNHDDANSSSFAGSPAATKTALASPPASAGHLASSSGAGSSYEDGDSSHSGGEDDLGIKSWYSPHPRGSARRRSLGGTGGRAGRTGERAAPVGPKTKPRRGRTLDMDMEEAEEALIGETAASAESELFPRTAVAEAAEGAARWTATAMEVVDLKAELSRLQGQLEDTETSCAKAVAAVEAQRDAAVGRQEELSEDLRRARQAAERLTVSEEDAVIAVEKDMRAKHKRDVAALQERASKAEERVLVLEPLEIEVLRLRDEVDILRPAETKLAKVEQNLSRCREKIEELSPFPGQLKKEEDAHAKVLDRCLELEAEVSQIPQLKRQLDRYRRSHTDMEVANREKSRELEMAQDEVTRLSQEVRALADGSGAARNEHRRLQEELYSRALEDTERAADGAGIGEGMSELNPALTEELARLRRTNEQLLAKVDYNTEETIRELEQKADDSNRLADSFHQNLASERELRAAAETSLAAARARIAELEAELTSLLEEHRRTVARMEAEAAAAEAAAAAALAAASKESCERLATAEKSAADALQAERGEAVKRLGEAEERAERDVEALRREMAAAAEAAAVAAAGVDAERGEERADFEARLAAAAEAVTREEERAAVELAAAEERWEKERKEMESVAEGERREAARKEEEAARGLVAAKRAFETEVEEVRVELEARLEEERRVAADEVAVAREKTAKEEERRLEESRLKDEAKQKVHKLEETLSAGKQAALKTIARLETNAREQREEAAALQEEMLADHGAKMAALSGEFQQYREMHTVDDVSYNNDMDHWEISIATKNKRIAELQAQVDALEKDKRRLEREKTYYWGQAEELRISAAAAGGRADPARDAEHLQLVEQTRDLIEENRELRQRAQDGGGVGGMNTRSGGPWGSSGVAAMRAEHEAEMTALKEEKQDMLLKYHATSSKLNEQERRYAELQGELEEASAQVVRLQLENKRNEKRLRDSETSSAAPASSSTPKQTEREKEKENQAWLPPSATEQQQQQRGLRSTRESSTSKGRASFNGDDDASDGARAAAAFGKGPGVGAKGHGHGHGQRGPLRGLGNPRQELQGLEHTKASRKEQAGGGVGVGVTGLEGEDESPPECVQS
eukprot:g12730.t1